MESISKKMMGFAAACALALASCSGSDAATTSAPVISATTPVTIATTTTLPANQPVTYVTEGAKVVVINASRVDGAAGRMTDQLKAVGYTLGSPTNSGSTLQRIDVSQVYYIEADAQAKAVADSLRLALGGGEIQVLPMPTPAPTANGELEAGTTVIVAVGNDTADQTLDELQGITTDSGGTDTGGSDETGDTTDSSESTTTTTVGTGSTEATTTTVA